MISYTHRARIRIHIAGDQIEIERGTKYNPPFILLSLEGIEAPRRTFALHIVFVFLIFRMEILDVPYKDERYRVFEVRQDVPQAKRFDVPREARVRREIQDS